MSSPSYHEQAIYILDTTVSINSSTGAFVSFGDIAIAATTLSTGTSTGSLIVSGGVAIQGTLFGNNATFTSTTQSVSTATGSLIVSGGVGIAKDIYVGGDQYITGNLYVNGVTTSINTTTLNVSDNTILLNSGPSGSRDAGILIQRFQVDNNLAQGDVVSNTEPIAYSGIVESGTTTTVVFDIASTPSAVDDFYKNWWIKITDGAAQDNVRKILSYVGSSRTATLSSALTTAPSALDNFQLYNRTFISQFFDESANELVYGYTPTDTDIQLSLDIVDFANLRLAEVYAEAATIGNIVASSISAGSLQFNSANVLNLSVSNGATINNLINNTATIGTLFVTNGSVLHGGLTSGSIFNTGQSVLNGANTLGGLFVTGPSTLSFGLTTGSIFNTGQSILNGANTLGGLFVTGPSTLSFGLTSGSIFNTGESILNGANTLGALFVTGPSTLSFGLTSGSIFNTGESILNGANTLGGLLVTGSSILVNGTTIGTSLFVTCPSIFTNITANTLSLNTVDFTPSLGDIFTERTFAAANNQSAFANITGLLFANANVRSFEAFVSVYIDATTDRFALFTLKAVQRASNWVLNTSFIGDNNTGIVFRILSTGQVQYTSTNLAGFVTDTMKFRATSTLSV
jgi:hypothetical protein